VQQEEEAAQNGQMDSKHVVERCLVGCERNSDTAANGLEPFQIGRVDCWPDCKEGARTHSQREIDWLAKLTIVGDALYGSWDFA
jgi:uncharacterized membrane protein